MEKIIPIKRRLKITLEIVFCLLICMVGMYYVLDLKNFNISIPYIYTGDGLSSSLFIKGTIENGWYNVNPNLGAPFGLEMYDYPLGGDNFQYLIMKFIALFSGNYVVVMNIYYFLTFPLCMIAAFLVLKNLRVEFFLSLSISLLYTFLPYHIIRTGHLFLLGYYMVPLVTMVILWIAHKENFLLTQISKYKFNFTINRYFIISILICILTGSTGAYYAFFACFFILIIGLISWLNEKDVRKLLVSFILICIVAVSLIVNISPSIYSKLNNPKENSVSSRNFEAAETYGLKIAQLVLPTTNHNVDWIKEKKDEYNTKAPLVNENDTSSLGIIGSVGFLMLILHLFLRKKVTNKYNVTLSALNISAVLLGTIGGFGVLFAAIVSAQIRSYNRLSVFIAFFSFLFIALSLNSFVEQKLKLTLRKLVYVILSIFIILFGMFDQSSHSLVPSKVIAEEYNSDANFVQAISESLPESSMIFQIPYVSFPEGENIKNLGNYDLLKGYIHSQNLSWSFGIMKNSYGDRWIKEMVKLPVQDSLNILAKVGYAGIYIDRNGYTAAYVDELEAEIKKLTNSKPLVSSDKELVFYSLKEYTEKLKNTTSSTDWNQQKDEILSSIVYKTNYVISGKEEWALLENKNGYKIIQTDYFQDLPINQEAINLTNKEDERYSFNDSFLESNHFSNRHWELPGHFVISLSNKNTGWDEDFIPTKEDIQHFFGNNNYALRYTSDKNVGNISFLERE